jgi:hypothetical protein
MLLDVFFENLFKQFALPEVFVGPVIFVLE